MDSNVLVGVDGSQQSLLALDWAADEAAARSMSLRIVTALPHAYSLDGDGGGDGRRGAAEVILAAAERRARRRRPNLAIATRLLRGRPAEALAAAAADAYLAVVGSRGLGSRSASLLGSVSLYLATRAPCPVVVIRTPPRQPPGRQQRPEIVVRIDVDQPEEDVLGFAFTEASRRRLPMRIVHGTSDEALTDGTGTTEVPPGWQDKYPGVRVICDARSTHPRHALLAASQAAELLVVGTERLTGFAPLKLESITYGVLRHAQCPVAVVPRQAPA